MEFDFSTLIIKKGGKLFKQEWSSKSKKYIQKDITKEAMFHIFDGCVLDEDVTLKDVLLLIKKDLKFWTIILRNWVEDIVNEGLSKKKPKKKNPNEIIEYLELYWYYEIENFNKKKEYELQHPIFPGFHGVGTIDGNPANWAIEFSPVYELVNLPLKLSDELVIYDWSKKRDKKGKYDPKYHGDKYKSSCYSLGQILYGIVWELSFFGSPKDRDEKKTEIDMTIRDIEKDLNKDG